MTWRLTNALKRPLRYFYAHVFPKAFKERHELAYWRKTYFNEGERLSHAHYEALYTKPFGLDLTDYAGKKVLDIGCGPRGSLEWATMAEQRVGLDPLIPQYLKLGADQHEMEYCASSSEHIPFPSGHFDIVTCLNALDHVDDIEKTMAEIKRVTKTGGLFLLSVEIDHPPTPTEPITVTRAVLMRLEPEFKVAMERYIGTPDDHNLHTAVMNAQPPYRPGEPGIYVAKMERR